GIFLPDKTKPGQRNGRRKNRYDQKRNSRRAIKDELHEPLVSQAFPDDARPNRPAANARNRLCWPISYLPASSALMSVSVPSITWRNAAAISFSCVDVKKRSRDCGVSLPHSIAASR